MTEDLLIQTLKQPKESIDDINTKIDGWLSKECPDKHQAIEHRLTSLELRVYGIVTFAVFFMTLFGDKVKGVLHL